MPPPVFAPAYQPQPYAPAVRPAPTAWQQPVAQQVQPRPIIRAQAPDEVPTPRPAPPSRPTLLTMPSPEALGLAPNKPAEVDWTAIHQRLDRLGATCFQVDRPSPGSYRVTCLLPGTQSGQLHRIESQAANEAEALRLALVRAEEWHAQQR